MQPNLLGIISFSLVLLTGVNPTRPDTKQRSPVKGIASLSIFLFSFMPSSVIQNLETPAPVCHSQEKLYATRGHAALHAEGVCKRVNRLSRGTPLRRRLGRLGFFQLLNYLLKFCEIIGD
jgi:hypothetical protein